MLWSHPPLELIPQPPHAVNHDKNTHHTRLAASTCCSATLTRHLRVCVCSWRASVRRALRSQPSLQVMQSEAHAAVARGSLDAAYAARLPPQPKRDLPDTSPSSERTVSMFSRFAACLRCKLQPCTASHASIADLCTMFYFALTGHPPACRARFFRQSRFGRHRRSAQMMLLAGRHCDRHRETSTRTGASVSVHTCRQPYSDILVRPLVLDQVVPQHQLQLPLSTHSPQDRTHVDGRHM